MNKRIVTIGGGSGQSELLYSLRSYGHYISAVVSTMDDGGSSGVLRDAYGVLPPGDIRRCIAALSPQAATLNKWWEYRFSDGPLAQHTVGNIVLTALTHQSRSMQEAVDTIGRLFEVAGEVLPVTEDVVTLIAELTNGERIVGETHIDVPQHDASLHIRTISLDRPARLNARVTQAIAQADMIVLTPGDLYTSVLPNFLVDDFSAVLAQSTVPIVYVCNRTTKKGETHDFTTDDFFNEISRYAAPASLTHIIVDNGTVPIPEHAQYVTIEKPSASIQVIQADIADEKSPEIVSGTKAAAIIHELLCTS